MLRQIQIQRKNHRSLSRNRIFNSVLQSIRTNEQPTALSTSNLMKTVEDIKPPRIVDHSKNKVLMEYTTENESPAVTDRILDSGL